METGANYGDILVGIAGQTRNEGMRIKLLEDLHPPISNQRLDARIELLSEGDFVYSRHLRPLLGREMSAKELHDSVCKAEGKGWLHFLNLNALAIESQSAVAPQFLEDARAELTSFDYWKGQREEPNRVWREIEQRRGQPEFRKRLLDAYNGRCAMTECDVEDALEAAHIDKYSESYWNDVKNGLLLRADIHTLFDVFLISINPTNYRMEAAEELRNSSHYRSLFEDLKPICLPRNKAQWPDLESVARHYATFVNQNR